MHVAKLAAGYWIGLYRRRRLPGGLAPVTRLAILAPVGDVSPHPLPQELVRYEAAGGSDAGVRHAMQGGKYLPPVAGGHQWPSFSSCASGWRFGGETVQPGQGLLQPGTAIRSGGVVAGWSGCVAAIWSGSVGAGWSGGVVCLDMVLATTFSLPEYRCCVGFNFFEKNPNGCQLEEGEGRCCRAAPTWYVEASTMRQISAPGVGCASRAALARAALMLVKAASMSADHGTLSLALPLHRGHQ